MALKTPMTKKPQIPIEHIQAMAVDLARRSFYAYCRLRVPKLYTQEHGYLKELCDTLQDFAEDKLLKPDGTPYTKIALLMPPRHGKTLSTINLCQWLFGKDVNTSIISVSYNETLSTRAAKAVRDGIQERKVSPNRLVYSDFFPGTKIKAGDASMSLWSLEGRHFSYLASSPGGSLTGMGSNWLFVDDLIKNWDEACNERILDEHWDFYQNTLLSRLEAGAKQVLINTRWASGDMFGKLSVSEPGEWYVVQKPACIDESTKTMLAPDILSYDELDRRRKTGDAQLISANYQQEPYDRFDKLYGEFKTYNKDLLPELGTIENYTDTADEGSDYLCSITYKVHNNTAYVLDLVYSKESMESTEGQVSLMLINSKANVSHIESNNGGKGFARNIERIMREISGYTGCYVKWFHQSANKVARILSNTTNVNNSIIFPNDWDKRWPEFYKHVTRAGRQEKWTNDDAFDCLTGIYEKSIDSNRITITKNRLPNL